MSKKGCGYAKSHKNSHRLRNYVTFVTVDLFYSTHALSPFCSGDKIQVQVFYDLKKHFAFTLGLHSAYVNGINPRTHTHTYLIISIANIGISSSEEYLLSCIIIHLAQWECL